jgi:hypothetical protein
MIRRIFSLAVLAVCACAPADFSLAEPEDQADGATVVDSSNAGDASPSDVIRLESGFDAGGDTSARVDTASPTDTLVPPPDGVGPIDAVVDSTDRIDSGGGLCGTKTCDDFIACTTDRCDSTTGACMNVLIDGDGDGFASKALGACGQDCNDAEFHARPGQPSFFNVPHVSPSGASSWDWNCDGIIEQSAKTVGVCYYDDAGFCVFTAGFSITAPVCGATKLYVTSCTLSGESCTPGGTMITQTCR